MIDLERCTGCKSCEAACKQEHRLGPGEYRNKVVWASELEEPGLAFLTLTCQHCERPGLPARLPGPSEGDREGPVTGVVRVVESRCTGCGECVIACPYSAMGYDPREHHAVKCDLCAERRAQGATTACASVCPTRAIRFGTAPRTARRSRAPKGARRATTITFLLGPATIYLERIACARDEPDARVPARLRPRDSQAPGIHGCGPGGSKRDARIRPAFPYGEPRAAGNRRPRRAGRLQHLLQLLQRQVPLQGRPAGAHHRQRGRSRCSRAGSVPSRSSRCSCTTASTACASDEARRRARRGPLRAHLLGPGARRDCGKAQGRARPVRLRGARDVRRHAHRHLDEPGYTALRADVGHTQQGRHRSLLRRCKNVAFEITQGRVGSGNSYTEADLGSASLYVYIGDNQAETRPVYFGMINDWRLKERREAWWWSIRGSR
jgi:Fe-S-cluster-containing dehydrogenase component